MTTFRVHVSASNLSDGEDLGSSDGSIGRSSAHHLQTLSCIHTACSRVSLLRRCRGSKVTNEPLPLHSCSCKSSVVNSEVSVCSVKCGERGICCRCASHGQPARLLFHLSSIQRSPGHRQRIHCLLLRLHGERYNWSGRSGSFSGPSATAGQGSLPWRRPQLSALHISPSRRV